MTVISSIVIKIIGIVVIHLLAFSFVTHQDFCENVKCIYNFSRKFLADFRETPPHIFLGGIFLLIFLGELPSKIFVRGIKSKYVNGWQMLIPEIVILLFLTKN